MIDIFFYFASTLIIGGLGLSIILMIGCIFCETIGNANFWMYGGHK